MLRHNRFLIISAFLIVFMASMACNYPAIKNSVVQEEVPISTEAVQSLESDIEQAVEQAIETGKLSLLITESQLTSLVAIELQTVEEVQITNVQILLRDDQIQVQCNLAQDGIQIPAVVIVSVYPDPEGKLGVNVISAKIGPLPIPESATRIITDTITATIQEEIFKTLPNLHIDAIDISDGKMNIEGHLP